MISQILENRVQKGDKVLDVGTKHGKTVSNLPGTVVGVDVELDPQVGDVCFCLADGKRLPFDSNSFDYVVCTQVLEHLPGKGTLVEEMSRVLRPDGVLYVNFPNRMSPDRPHSPPGWYSYLPKKLGVALAPFVLGEETAEYYEGNVFNLSPIRARRLLHEHFASVRYDTFLHKSECRDIYLGADSAEGYDPNTAGRLVAKSLPVLRRMVKIPVVGWSLELLYPHSEYTCGDPRQP